MKKLLRNVLILGAVIALGAFTLRPVPILPEDQCEKVSGIVDRVWVTESHDIFFVIKDDPRRFYMNRGTEYGISEEDAYQLEGQSIMTFCPDYFTLLDPRKKTRHVTKVIVDETVIFSEYP
ncbi:MAG: hypothetical protein MK081_12215 [Flavobacteriales bacterium]|nr:hypothetical protein [Flavobacteriales bacterium]